MPVPEEISRYCSSLVAIVKRVGKRRGSNIEVTEIQLSHFSVKEWLVSDQIATKLSKELEQTAACATMAKVCLTYLVNLDHNLEESELVVAYPFAKYSTTYWTVHAALGEMSDNGVSEMVVKLFSSSPWYQTSFHLLERARHTIHMPNTRLGPCLCFAAQQGLLYCSQKLIKNGMGVNTQCEEHGTALYAASFNGYDTIVELLLNNGADINAEGGDYGNALQAASFNGYDTIVDLLLNKGADINAQGGRYGNALQVASYKGHDMIIQLLRERGADKSSL